LQLLCFTTYSIKTIWIVHSLRFNVINCAYVPHQGLGTSDRSHYTRAHTHAFGSKESYEFLITHTNLIHFTVTITLLKLKTSTCFGHHLPIRWRHYKFMEPGSVYFGLREKKNQYFPVPCSECILLSALFSSRRTDCPEHIHTVAR
jgi:hypothetical protein